MRVKFGVNKSPSPLQFLKLLLMVEAKMVTFSDMVLNVSGGNILAIIL